MGDQYDQTVYVESASDEAYQGLFLEQLSSILGLELKNEGLSLSVLLGVMEMIVHNNLVEENKKNHIEKLLKAIYSTGTESVSPNAYKQYAKGFQVRYAKQAAEKIEVGLEIDEQHISQIAAVAASKDCKKISVTGAIRLTVESVNLIAKTFQHLVNMIHFLSLHINTIENIHALLTDNAVVIPILAPIVACAFAFLLVFEVLIVLSHVLFPRNEAAAELSFIDRGMAALSKDGRGLRMATYAPLCLSSALVWAGVITTVAATHILAGVYIFVSLLKICKLSQEINQLEKLKNLGVGKNSSLSNDEYIRALDKKIAILKSERRHLGMVATGFSIALGCSIAATMVCPPAAAALAGAAIVISMVAAFAMAYRKLNAKSSSVDTDDLISGREPNNKMEEAGQVENFSPVRRR